MIGRYEIRVEGNDIDISSRICSILERELKLEVSGELIEVEE